MTLALAEHHVVETTLTSSQVFDFKSWEARLPELQIAYQNALPFPHIVLENFLTPLGSERALADFDHVDWQLFRHVNENKSGNRNRSFPAQLDIVMQTLNSDAFLEFLSKLTGIKGLIADHGFGSGGVHRSMRGGFLNIHADFTVHPYNTNWRRRINVLIYLNPKWEENWGGYLELWKTDMSECMQKIAPLLNRCVIFNTDYDSYHGHPEPMTCPEDIKRQSIALYYYTQATDMDRAVATSYRPRPKDGKIKSLFMHLDNRALDVFHAIKTKLGIKDTVATNLFSLFKRK